jgi:carboxymethylenebutenolidase
MAQSKNMQTQTVEVKVKDANDMLAYVAAPDDKNIYPGILVFQEAFGVNNHIKKVTEKIASEGYVAIAPELFHRTAPAGTTISYNDFDSVRPHMAALTVDGLAEDIKAAYGWLQQSKYVEKNKIGAVGFCLGGRVSFLANSILPLNAAVSYYGGSIQTITDKAKTLHGPQLFFWGGLDKHILPEHRDAVMHALDEANKEYINTVLSYADHGFNCDERPAYSSKAAKEAWAMTSAFFKNNLVQ